MENTQASTSTPWITVISIIAAVFIGAIAWLYFSEDEKIEIVIRCKQQQAKNRQTD